MQPADLAYDDYLLIADFEIGIVRESVGRRSAEKDGHVNFLSIASRGRLDYMRLPASFSN